MTKKSIALLPGLISRADELEFIRRHATNGACCSIVGVSNLGKSAFLRHLCASAREGAFVYVDCNAMPERTARAFFIAIIRALADTLERRASTARERARALFDELCAAPNATDLALCFDAGLTLALAQLPPPLVLCLDDFDEAYRHLEPQTFLNLRALKDKHDTALAYVTATERELARMTTTREQGEFMELVAPRVQFLGFWNVSDTREYCRHFAAREGVTFSADDLAFIEEHADGHPGIAQAVCYALGAVTGAPTRNQHQDRVIHQLVQRNLLSDSNVQSECEKIWDDLDADERAVLFTLPHNDDPSPAQRSLRAKFILRDTPDGAAIFPRVFAEYVRRQHLAQHPQPRGVYIDVDAGAVFVEGRPVGELTDLEYRLIAFLYGKLDRVCDKFSLVENVWGQQFIDEVDDARIEKLVSRLRAKIEPDPAKPRYLVSVRGRGYKLVR
ncbi:MAG: winged helix-turn-helix domain-containing protein [Chloroflexi bacterium]|nr:winged helix-turn-helix domain-containing protein [Chloroflexota bacterium]